MLPQFSIRVVLILVTVAAALSAAGARAVQGDAWAIGVAAAVAWAALALVVHALFYLAALALSSLEEDQASTGGAGFPAEAEEAPVE